LPGDLVVVVGDREHRHSRFVAIQLFGQRTRFLSTSTPTVGIVDEHEPIIGAPLFRAQGRNLLTSMLAWSRPPVENVNLRRLFPNSPFVKLLDVVVINRDPVSPARSP
jgi:hypothetical protein